MRSVPLLALTGVLGLLLTACPAAGPSFDFTGTYSGTFTTLRDIAQLPEALRGPPVTVTATLTQSGTSVSGTLSSTAEPAPSTISAMVLAPGEASGTLTEPPPRGGMSTPIRLSLTAQQDLVIWRPGALIAFVLERQP
ncbi:MAG: hypothetical protein HY335_01020 [Deinococcus sp.]|nr:hypothetical protein [Deinococcus sp.]